LLFLIADYLEQRCTTCGIR